MKFSAHELLHYSRHFNLSEVGHAGQERLKNSRIVCVGAGGLGSAALLYLTAAGVGTIGIVDDDHVEISNLQRQVLYNYKDVGIKKVIAANNHLNALNPSAQIKQYDSRLTLQNAREILSDYDFILDCSDNFATRNVINAACVTLKKPYVYASISQFTGQCSVFAAQNGPCYRCLFSDAPDFIPNCRDGGVLGVLPGILGAIQATEILKLILHIGSPLIGRMLQFDALTMGFREFEIPINPDCQCHTNEGFAMIETNVPAEISVTELYNMRQDQAEFILLDVREVDEYQEAHMGGKHIPLGELPNKMAELDKDQYIVVHCMGGGRSKRAMQFLQGQGFSKVSNLAGGMRAWQEKYPI